MSLLPRIRPQLRLWFRRSAVETELDAEVQAFYTTLVEWLVEKGTPREEAIRLVNLKFNLPEQAKEEIREARAGEAIAAFCREVRYASRVIQKAPAFASVTILTLGLGIAANCTIFSIVSRFVVSAPPVGDPNSLMALHTTHQGECCDGFSWPLFSDLRAQVKSFSGVAGCYELVPASVGGRREPERVSSGPAATANFFDVSQLGMSLGRGFAPTEEQASVIVLGYSLWRHRFAGDSSILGKVITLSGRPSTSGGRSSAGFPWARHYSRLPVLGPDRRSRSVTTQYKQPRIALLPLAHRSRETTTRSHAAPGSSRTGLTFPALRQSSSGDGEGRRIPV